MKNFVRFGFLLIIPVLLISCGAPAKKQADYIKSSGEIYGTFYNIAYLHPQGQNLQEKIDKRMQEFNGSLSTFDPNSVISRINNNDDSVRTDAFFESMFNEALKVSTITGGAFDITVAPLVNAWGFGFGNHDTTAIPDVQSFLAYTGYGKIRMEDHRIIKSDRRIMLDASAIAKGQASDVIGQLLESEGCVNYMVEIGGEVACKGVNPKGKPWQIGIDKPSDDPADENKELQTIVGISGVGLATSGNYRQFYYKDGKKYAHTIDPRTGFPVDHNLLSATVIAPSCMQADAFATAFMVLGVDSSLTVCDQVPDMECYLIYTDKKGAYQVAYTEGFKKYFSE